MWALIFVFASLASAIEYDSRRDSSATGINDIASGHKQDPDEEPEDEFDEEGSGEEGRVLVNITEGPAGNVSEEAVKPKFVNAPPSTPGGASVRVRKVLCPRAITVTGISKRALGCTISDIFGEAELSPSYMKKLRHWAEVMSEKNAVDPNGYSPEVSLDRTAMQGVNVEAMFTRVTEGANDGLADEMVDGRFGKQLIPDVVEVPEDAQVFKALPQRVVRDPATEMEEAEQAVEDRLRRPVQVTVEIPQEELPWNVPAGKKAKDIMTRTTTGNPFRRPKELVDPRLLPWSSNFNPSAVAATE